MKTKGFRFVDLFNYLGPGTTYEKWVKAYGCSDRKSWFCYEWFDSTEKLNYPGLPDYSEWYSRRRVKMSSRSEFQQCKKIFIEKGMQTFAD